VLDVDVDSATPEGPVIELAPPVDVMSLVELAQEAERLTREVLATQDELYSRRLRLGQVIEQLADEGRNLVELAGVEEVTA
jgi:hypothetical protein